MNDRDRTSYMIHSRLAGLTLLLLAVCLTGCGATRSLAIRVDAAHEAGAQYAPEELARMMTDLGYRQLRVEDPVTQQSVAVGERYGEYRLLFESLENSNIRVDIHADKTDGRIALYFYNVTHGPLDSSGHRLYEQLLERVRFEYGDAHVHADRLP